MRNFESEKSNFQFSMAQWARILCWVGVYNYMPKTTRSFLRMNSLTLLFDDFNEFSVF